jgi:hypothetical protein
MSSLRGTNGDSKWVKLQKTFVRGGLLAGKQAAHLLTGQSERGAPPLVNVLVRTCSKRH